MNSVNHHDVAEEIHFPWTLLDGALTRNLVKKFDGQHQRKNFLKHTYIRAKLLLCFVQIAFLEKMAGYSRMAVSATGACKRRVFPSIHLRSLSSSRVVGCLAFRVCCFPHAECLPICVVYRWYMSMTEQDILQLLFYSETSSSSSYLEQLLQFSRTWFPFCEVNELELSNSLCALQQHPKEIYTPIMQTTPNLFLLLYQLNWRHLC
jgi:hypothetical protein